MRLHLAGRSCVGLDSTAIVETAGPLFRCAWISSLNSGFGSVKRVKEGDASHESFTSVLSHSTGQRVTRQPSRLRGEEMCSIWIRGVTE